MKKALALFLFSLSSLWLAPVAQADTKTTGLVKQIRLNQSGTLYMALEDGTPLCSGNATSRHVGYFSVRDVDPDTREMFLSILARAKLSKSPVKVVAEDGVGTYGCRLKEISI